MDKDIEFEPVSVRVLLAKIGVVAIALITSLSFLALYVPPQVTVFFQWIGVLLPFLLGCNLILLVIGIYKRSWYSICALIAILSNFHYFSKIVQINKQENVRQADISLATYNVRQFKMVYNMSSIDHIADFIASNKVNALCLQEVPPDYSLADLRRAFNYMPYAIMTGSKDGHNQLAILSKYPLDSVQTVSFEERPNCALFADMTVKNEKIRIGNCHLQTTNWNQVKGALYMPDSGGGWLEAFQVVSSNFRYRGKQVDELQEMMGKSPYPMLMCGDFNNSPISYSYNTIKGNLKDAFCEAGNGYGYTYTNLKKLFRIDFVFFSDAKFQAWNYRTGDVDYSDHLPVLTDFTMN